MPWRGWLEQGAGAGRPVEPVMCRSIPLLATAVATLLANPSVSRVRWRQLKPRIGAHCGFVSSQGKAHRSIDPNRSSRRSLVPRDRATGGRKQSARHDIRMRPIGVSPLYNRDLLLLERARNLFAAADLIEGAIQLFAGAELLFFSFFAPGFDLLDSFGFPR